MDSPKPTRLREIRIRVPESVAVKLEKARDDDGRTTLQSFLVPIITAVANGDIKRTYDWSPKR